MRRRRVLWWLAWYLSIGLAVGIETGAHQAARFDPGFDPTFTAALTVLVWPVVLAEDGYYFVTHRRGERMRHPTK